MPRHPTTTPAERSGGGGGERYAACMHDPAGLDTTDDRLDGGHAPEPSPPTTTSTTTSTTTPADELVDEMLIEEISIDGMCGVY